MSKTPICGIYYIKNLVNEKYYIGQSVDIKRRWNYEKCKLNSEQDAWNLHLQSAWRLYGPENFEFHILEICPTELLDEREQYWVSFYDAYNNGYNQTIGGNGNRGHIVTEETRVKVSQSLKNSMTDERLRQIGENSKKAWENQQRRDDMSRCVLEWWNNPEHKDKMSGKNSWAYKNSDGTYNKYPINVVNNAPCVQIETGSYYHTLTEAGKQTGIPRENIGKVCRGERKTASGYHWRCATEDEISQYLSEIGVCI